MCDTVSEGKGEDQNRMDLSSHHAPPPLLPPLPAALVGREVVVACVFPLAETLSQKLVNQLWIELRSAGLFGHAASHTPAVPTLNGARRGSLQKQVL